MPEDCWSATSTFIAVTPSTGRSLENGPPVGGSRHPVRRAPLGHRSPVDGFPYGEPKCAQGAHTAGVVPCSAAMAIAASNARLLALPACSR
jgi:hypothetical protein